MAMSLPRARAHKYAECLGNYGIQSEAYAWASGAPEHQIVQKSPLSEGSSTREGARGRDRHPTFQPKDFEVRWRKVQAMKRWACAMVSRNEIRYC